MILGVVSLVGDDLIKFIIEWIVSGSPHPELISPVDVGLQDEGRFWLAIFFSFFILYIFFFKVYFQLLI